MLVLSRKPGEEIVIGDNIVVRVASIRGNRVRIAIEAPREMKVSRREGEVWQPRDSQEQR